MPPANDVTISTVPAGDGDATSARGGWTSDEVGVLASSPAGDAGGSAFSPRGGAVATILKKKLQKKKK